MIVHLSTEMRKNNLHICMYKVDMVTISMNTLCNTKHFIRVLYTHLKVIVTKNCKIHLYLYLVKF